MQGKTQYMIQASVTANYAVSVKLKQTDLILGKQYMQLYLILVITFVFEVKSTRSDVQ